jgi:hypothetical protein
MGHLAIAWHRLPETLFGKGLARTGFEILFERSRIRFGRYGDIGFQANGQLCLCGDDLAAPMRFEPAPKVVS